MRILGLDLETTGFSIEDDYITEMAYIIKDTSSRKPLRVYSMLAHEDGITVPKAITELTGIEQWMLNDYGECLENLIGQLNFDIGYFKVDYIIAHNGENFDKPFLTRQVGKYCPSFTGSRAFTIPWIDTRHDVTYPPGFTSHRLNHLAAELGFLNPFPHSALFDVATMLRILENFDIEKTVERSKIPWIIIQAHVKYETRELAKKARFSWEKCGDKEYPKTWVKRIKACDLEAERAAAIFEISIVQS